MLQAVGYNLLSLCLWLYFLWRWVFVVVYWVLFFTLLEGCCSVNGWLAEHENNRWSDGLTVCTNVHNVICVLSTHRILSHNSHCHFFTDCTYSHFERSSQCPTCRKTLGDQDFTELVVADGSNGASDIAKSSMQAMFSKKGSGGYLPHAELCQSLIRQIDASKQNTKFLLKQLLVETHKQSRGNMGALRAQEQLRNENTQLKQTVSSQRLQYEQTIKDLQNKLKARESTIQELHGMLGKFQKHCGGKIGSDYSVGGASSVSSHHMVPGSSSGRAPLGGIIAKRQERENASKNVMSGRFPGRQPFMNDMNHGRSPGTGYNRPYSSNSVGSGSSGGIRSITANSGYNFTAPSNQQQNSSLNKRRRSPTTAFTNSGPRYPQPRHGPLFNSNRSWVQIWYISLYPYLLIRIGPWWAGWKASLYFVLSSIYLGLELGDTRYKCISIYISTVSTTTPCWTPLFLRFKFPSANPKHTTTTAAILPTRTPTLSNALIKILLNYASYSESSGSLKPLRVDDEAIRAEAESYLTSWSRTFLTMQKLEVRKR